MGFILGCAAGIIGAGIYKKHSKEINRFFKNLVK